MSVPVGHDALNLRGHYEQRIPLLRGLASSLDRALREQLAGLPHIDRVSFRVKEATSFVEKVVARRVDPPYTQPLVEVEDQVAGRVIVFFSDDIAVVQEAVGRLLTSVEAERREPDRYNVFDYESFHAVYTIPPQYLPAGWETIDPMPETFELQIRTLFQHAYAEPQHDVAYKPTADLTREDKRELAWIAASAWGADKALMRVRKRVDERAAAKP